MDTDSTFCTISEEAEQELRRADSLLGLDDVPGDIVLIDCGGVKPKCVYHLKMEVYGNTFVVPVLVVPGQ